MESSGKFLLGGALGAALGYLLSKQGLEQTQEVAEERMTPAPAREATTPTWSAPVSTPPAPVEAVSAPVPEDEPEITLDRQLIDEPLPGSGWSPSAPSAVEDDTMEATVESMMLDEVMEVPLIDEVVEAPAAEVFEAETETQTVDVETTQEASSPSRPMGPGTAGTEALAQAATVAGGIPLVETPSAQDSARVDDLKSRIEETRRRIRHELEQPFEAPSSGGAVESDWTMAPAVPIAEPMEETLTETAEQEVVEPVMMEEPIATQEALIAESPTMESPTMESPTMESTEVEVPAVEPETPVEAGPPVMETPVVRPAVEEQAPAAAAPIDLETTVSDADATAEAIMEPVEPVDYDSMKSRIESTRSRLKAKAFDAMMTGESALLGRDLEGTRTDQGEVAGVDDEVDETIETSLREEEE